MAELSLQERRKRLQLYVFILRCVAYPFNAKQPNDMSRRQMKVTKEQLETLQKRFQAFLKGETTIAADEAFQNAVQSYTEVRQWSLVNGTADRSLGHSSLTRVHARQQVGFGFASLAAPVTNYVYALFRRLDWSIHTGFWPDWCVLFLAASVTRALSISWPSRLDR